MMSSLMSQVKGSPVLPGDSSVQAAVTPLDVTELTTATWHQWISISLFSFILLTFLNVNLNYWHW